MSRSGRICQDLPVDVKISPFVLVCCEFFFFLVFVVTCDVNWNLCWPNGFFDVQSCLCWGCGWIFSFIFCCIILCLVAGCLCCFWCEIFGWVYRIIWLCKPDQPNRIHPTNPITRTVLADWHFGWLMDMISLNSTWSGRVKYYPQTRPAQPKPTPTQRTVSLHLFQFFSFFSSQSFSQFFGKSSSWVVLNENI